MKIYIDETKKKVIEACIEQKAPVLLVGETGLGKTTIIREMAHEKKKNLIRVSLNGSTSTEEILGKWLAKDGSTFWQDGILISAMKNGDWIVFDEINAALPEVLFALQSLLDDDRKVTLIEKSNEVVKPTEDFMFFATMNPTEEYSGTKEMNKALISRFNAVVHIEVPSNVIEVKIIEDKGIDGYVATSLVVIADKLRQMKKDEQIYYFCSTRDLIHAGLLIKQGLTLEEASQYAISGKMSKQEQDFVSSKGIIPLKMFKEKVSLTQMIEENTKKEKEYKEALVSLKKFEIAVKEYSDKCVRLEEDVKSWKSKVKPIKSKEEVKKLMKSLLEEQVLALE